MDKETSLNSWFLWDQKLGQKVDVPEEKKKKKTVVLKTCRKYKANRCISVVRSSSIWEGIIVEIKAAIHWLGTCLSISGTF